MIQAMGRKKYLALGLMSGSSLDGLDIALCGLEKNKKHWKFSINEAETIPYPPEWKKKLNDAQHNWGEDLVTIHFDYGKYIGLTIREYLDKWEAKPEVISSHGHTIFHRPNWGLTVQIGDGPTIAKLSGVTTVYNFRHRDVALGGQGAPLAPMGDDLLFPEYDACLNLGGFSNVSLMLEGKRIGYDICPTNTLLNWMARNHLQKPFDNMGEAGRPGNIDNHLLSNLNSLGFYQKDPPKSLGWEWNYENVIPILEKYNGSWEDLFRTVYEHIALQISLKIPNGKKKRILVTGGGAHNIFLLELLQQKISSKFVIPEKKIIDYKESLIFALLGILRIRNEVNVLSAATGAIHDSIGGFIYRM